MSRRKRILLIAGASLAALLLILLAGVIVTVQTPWFANFARQKVIAAINDSTGGVTEIGSLDVDLAHLTLRLRNFVLHGKEPAGAHPLFTVKLLELRMKLFAGKLLDLRYLGVEQPEANLMLLADGTTNVPQPKHPSPPSQTSGLQTVVDLAVGEFHLENGLLQVLEQKTAFSLRGENLRALLNYSALGGKYTGSLAIDPILVRSANRPPLRLHLALPITLERDAIRVANAKLTTDRSQILLSGGLQNMNAPQITAQVQVRAALDEIERSFDVPIDATAKGAPRELTAQLAVKFNQQTNALRVETGHLALGHTTIDAAGSLGPGASSAVRFTADFALAELSRLLAVSSLDVQGGLVASGRATLDKRNNYSVDGTLDSRALQIRNGPTEISGVTLSSPFHADPFLISLDGLNLGAFGGSLSAKVFLAKLQNLSVEGHLRNLSVPALAATFSGKQLGYDGLLNGTLFARGNLKAKGTTGYTAQTQLTIEPGRRGIPLEGRLNARYTGSSGALDLGESYLALPNSRLDLTGSLNRLIDVKLTSRNLADFLPAINFGSDKPQTSLPVVLQNGGTALLQAKVNGNTAAPNIEAHVELNDFAVEQRSFNRLAADLSASSSGAAIAHGTLAGTGLDTRFDGSIGLAKWSPRPDSPLTANLILNNGELADLAALAGQSSIHASGAVTAALHVAGTYGNPTGAATLQVLNGSAYQQPFNKLAAAVNLTDQLITLSQLELDTAGGAIRASGDFRHPIESFTVGHAQFKIAADQLQLSQVQALARQNAGVGGAIQLSANLAADVATKDKQTVVTPSNLTADLSARNLQIQNLPAGELTASARTRQGNVEYRLRSNFAGAAVNVEGRTSLSRDYLTAADASIDHLSIEKTLQLVGQGAIPARGDFSAKAHLDGTVQAPNATLSIALLKANVYQEPIDSLQGSVKYTDKSVEISSLALQAPAGSLNLNGSFNHPADTLQTGSLRLNVSSSDIQLGEIKHVQSLEPGLAGVLRLAANLSGNVREEHGKRLLLLSDLTADATAAELHLGETKLGGMNFNARTSNSKLNLRLDSDLVQSRIHGTGEAQLTGDFPLRATLSFANVRYSNLAPLLGAETGGAPPMDALVEGQASINGPVLSPDELNARLQLDRVDLRSASSASATSSTARRVELQNSGPIVVSLSQSLVRIEQLHIAGRGTSLNASGTLNLKSSAEPLALHVDANVDLGLLQDADRDFYSSGVATLDTSIRGSLARPVANGQIELKNANINHASSPNGLSNANGIILLNGTNATIQSLTGESGGGKITLAGFVGLGSRTPSFNLQATASRVRVRTSGISATSNATLSLTGNMRRSLLSGTISIDRIAYASSGDTGSLLSLASTPPTTPNAPSPLLSGMRLAVHIVTAPDIQVVSTYANRFSIIANLTARGTAESPGMLGRVTVTDGQLVFFGNTYTVTTGTVNFYDPGAIAPVVNLSLDTITQGVDVTIGVSGPMNDLKLSYRSDPPLSFEQIVQLLATNTTPSNPVIAAHQPTPPQQSLSQMGESAVLGQAVANPLANRVQRVFGLSQFKIDPSFSGSNGQPSARVTLQQKIASNITFTYITDVTQTNAQIVRIQWDLTNNLSAVGLRDFNGNVSIEMFYKFKRR